MLYIFCDEDIQPVGTDWHYNFSAVAFYQSRFNNSGLSCIRNVRHGGKSLLPQIEQALSHNGSIALISHTVIPAELLPKGAKIKIDDTVKAALKDVVWSWCMISTIAKLVLLDQSWTFRTIDIFYDFKSLTEHYRDSIKQYIRNNVRQRLNQSVTMFNQNLGGKINVRRIEAVKKPQPGYPPDKFQLGVWLADRIVKSYKKGTAKKAGGLIITVDITNEINEMLIELLELLG
jgi:hypothetical protein